MAELQDKTYRFALNIVRTCNDLTIRAHNTMLVNKVMESGTGIGAIVSEAAYAQNNNEVVAHLYSALREANKAEYWLRLSKDAGMVSDEVYSYFIKELTEILKILINNIKTVKQNA